MSPFTHAKFEPQRLFVRGKDIGYRFCKTRMKLLLIYAYNRNKAFKNSFGEDPTKWMNHEIIEAAEWAVIKLAKETLFDAWNEGVDLI